MPIPYPNIGKSSDTTAGPTTVTTDGQMPMTQDAQYMMSNGDQAGSAMGVMSGTIQGPCEFMMYSFDVKFEGKNVCRLADPLFRTTRTRWGRRASRVARLPRPFPGGKEFHSRDADLLDAILHLLVHDDGVHGLRKAKQQQVAWDAARG